MKKTVLIPLPSKDFSKKRLQSLTGFGCGGIIAIRKFQRLAPDPDYRGLGIGKTLMQILIGHMKAFAEIKIIELDVMTSNNAAIKMYEGLGFKRVGIFPKAYIFPDGKVVDNLTMCMEV